VDAGSSTCSAFNVFEAISVFVFTAEYAMRLFAAPNRLAFPFTFYSLIDLLVIVPWFISQADPGGWIDRHNTTFLMLRILRLIKLDKAVPSLTLIDDVIRLKWNTLAVTGIVAGILWIIFANLMYMAERGDSQSTIDAVPLEGCSGDNCTESLRFTSAFNAAPFVFIHLTGDYPIIEYSLMGRMVCFLMVVLAAGIVSVPTGVIADGFGELVEKQAGYGSALRDYDIQFLKMSDEAPREFSSDNLNDLQVFVNVFMNGEADSEGEVKRSFASACLNKCSLMFILLSVAAVLAESMPAIDKAVGNEKGNYFDQFEVLSVGFFTMEYGLRMFSVTKDKLHLYSRWCYATTFFGIVDLLTIAPWYIQIVSEMCGVDTGGAANCFRLMRLFRLLELEHFLTAFSVLDNVFWRSRGVLLATGVLAFTIWVSAAALFFLFEQNNPNWCMAWADATCEANWKPGCECVGPSTFDTLPHALFMVAVFLAGEWPVVDFTFGGKLCCMALCMVGLGLAALPIATLFDSFGAVLEGGLAALDDEEEDADTEESTVTQEPAQAAAS
jgi:hypothetical protein